MLMGNYVLDGRGQPVLEREFLTWARWMTTHERVIARDTVGASLVSTVFLGRDHNFGRQGPPVLWETMVFGGMLNEEQDRCAGSMEQAEAMHARMVERVKAA